MLRYFLLFSLLGIQGLVFAQVNAPIMPVIRHLMAQRGKVQIIHSRLNQLLPKGHLPHELEDQPQFLVHHSSGLYLGVPGTGYLYRFSDSAGLLKLTRVDSTFYVGYNFHAAHFTARDTMYALGGYGFWKANGLLRYYKPQQYEWSVKRLNREVPVLLPLLDGTNFWLDPRQSHFYLPGTRHTNEGLMAQGRVDTSDGMLYRLDVGSGIWSTLGKLADNKYDGYNSPWGLLSHKTTKVWYLIDFAGNRTWYATAAANSRLEGIHSRIKADLIYFIDSTLYFGNISLPRFDSIKLSIRDFIPADEPVYYPIAAGGRFLWLWWLLVPVVIAGAYFVFRRRRSPAGLPTGTSTISTQPSNATGNGALRSRAQNDLFTPAELELLRYLLDRTRQSYLASPDEINWVLGLSGKNQSVQKKNRSEVISQINLKWANKFGSRAPLINRNRSELDKRIYEYFIDQAWLVALEREISDLS